MQLGLIARCQRRRQIHDLHVEMVMGQIRLRVNGGKNTLVGNGLARPDHPNGTGTLSDEMCRGASEKHVTTGFPRLGANDHQVVVLPHDPANDRLERNTRQNKATDLPDTGMPPARHQPFIAFLSFGAQAGALPVAKDRCDRQSGLVLDTQRHGLGERVISADRVVVNNEHILEPFHGERVSRVKPVCDGRRRPDIIPIRSLLGHHLYLAKNRDSSN